MLAQQTAQLTAALFGVTAPIAVLPMFVGMTAGQTVAQQRRTCVIAVITYCVICLVSVLLGNFILAIFGIDIPDLTLAGMLAIGVIGWNMLQSPAPSDDDESNTESAVAPPRVPTPSAIGVVPVGFPAFAGPGAMSVVMAFGSGANDKLLPAFIAVTINAVILFILTFWANWFTAKLGRRGMLVTIKIFGLFVLAIAVGGAIGALQQVFPGLTKV